MSETEWTLIEILTAGLGVYFLLTIFWFIKFWIRQNVKQMTVEELKEQLGEDFRKSKFHGD
ncbi:MAG: hypothetical protein CBB97_22395 [Candidatus Endolissoclinum sp. TMED37]|nr:MAG: hypothetical protein CBB97_22395 [Candidatus Endolissoclinum sp. TMED37]|tara:strand:+ start:112 stop:294 length:183 start_codon:yes stop_codon:yes gene_type:complete